MTSWLPVPLHGPHGRGRSVLTPRAQAAFLERLATSGNVRAACRAARVSPQTAYRARRRSPAFARAWDAAILAARAHAEAVLCERALEGWEEPVFYHGEEIARRRRFSDRLLLAHLARLDRMAERSDIAAALPHLDEAIERLKSGEALEDAPEILPDVSPKAARDDARDNSFQERVPPVPDCRDRAPSERPGPIDEEPGGEAREEDEDDLWLEARLCAMEEARPVDAPSLRALAGDKLDIGAIEAIQLEAFEAGEERWWLKTPPTERDSL